MQSSDHHRSNSNQPHQPPPQPFRGVKTQEERLAARKVERDEKKERARTIAFFTAAKNTLDDAATSHDVATVSGIVEGLVSELSKLLRSDKELHLLRNGTVCRTLETALSASPATLLQTKTVAYMLLGSISRCMASPTASYVMEALFSGLSCGVAFAASRADSSEEGLHVLDSELSPGGTGVHAGSGVPNTATLLQHIVDEVLESIDDLLVSDPGARCLRALAYTLRGLPPPQKHVSSSQPSHDSAANEKGPISAPSSSTSPRVDPASLPKFPELCARLTESVCESIERVFEPKQTAVERPRRADAWFAASQTTATSLIIQSMLRCSDADLTPDVYEHVVASIRSMKFADRSLLLSRWMEDVSGSHIYQQYMRVVPCRSLLDAMETRIKAAVAEADRTVRSHAVAESFVNTITTKAAKVAGATLPETSTASGEGTADSSPVAWCCAMVAACRSSDAGGADKKGLSLLPLFDDLFMDTDGSRLGYCPWSDAYECFACNADSWLSGDSEYLRQASFFLQDLATYSPTSAHLALLFTEVIFPRLELFLQLPALTAVLVRLTRKCAATYQRVATPAATSLSWGSASAASALIERDLRNGAIYHDVPAAMRGEILKVLLGAIKAACCGSGKSVPFTLLVDRSLGEHVGFELMCNFLQFGANPSAGLLLNSFDKLNVEGLASIAEHPQGSFVLQLWLSSASQYQPRKATTAGHHASTSAAAVVPSKQQPLPLSKRVAPLKGQKGTQTASLPSHPPSSSSHGDDQPLVRRMVRRLMPLMERLCGSKYGCHVVESLYEHCPQDMREELLQTVVPLYRKLHTSALEGSVAPGKRAREDEGPDSVDAQLNEANAERDAVAAGTANEFYARKTLQTLRVEQYLHRPEEWRGYVAKQHHVQSLMRRLLTLEDGGGQ